MQSPDLFDASFVDVFSFDLSKGVINLYDTGGLPETQLLGGSVFGLPTPLISSVLTINGHSVMFSGDATGQYDNRQGVLSSTFAESFDASNVYDFNIVGMGVNAPASLSQPYSGDAFTPDNYGGSFSICKYTEFAPGELACLQGDETLNGFLTPETVTVTVSGGVPEPASWLLMLAGFGGLGAELRRRVRGSAAQKA